MFEYKDDFLTGRKTAIENGEGDAHLCNASNAVEDQLAELSELVGNGSKLHPAGEVELIPLVDSAPALEFDLEDELSKAFAPSPEAAPQQGEVFDTGALEAAFNQDGSSSVEASSDTASQTAEQEASAIDFSDMIAEELDRALAEEVAADASLSAPEPTVAAADVSENVSDAPSDPNFGAELSRLMGEEASKPIPAPPAPGAIQEPWQAAEVVAGPDIPDNSELFAEPENTADWQPPQMSDFQSAPDYSDPAAEFDEAEPAATPQFNPSIPQESVHIESVLGGAAALGAAANTETSEVASTPVFDPHAHAQSNYEHDHQAGFDHGLSAPLDGSQGNEEALVIPAADMAPLSGGDGSSGRKAALAIVAVALLGGSVALGWNMIGPSSGPAPTLLASSEPVKVKPKDAGGKVVPNQDQAVYQSVDGGAKNAPKQERLKDDSEKPIAVAATPAPKKVETRVAGTDTSTTGGLVLQPRRVRTVVVRPDGTIVSATQSQPTSEAVPVAQVETPALALRPTPIEIATTGSQTTQPLERTLYQAPQTGEVEPAKVAKVEAVKVKPIAVKPAVVEPAALKPVAVKTTTPKPATLKPVVTKPAAAVPAKPVKVAKIATPKKVVAKPVKAVKVNTPSVSSPYAVQIASQRSPAAAKKSYATLSRRYASVLKGKGVDIRSGVVKGKGTYYRVRIPAQSRAAANTLCRQLKAKGGACFVTR